MTEPSIPENWLPVVGWEGLYEVSNLGRVRSLTRLLPHWQGGKRWGHGRILTPVRVTGGYYTIKLSDCTTKRYRIAHFIHVIVLRAFVGVCPPNHEIDHIDFNPANNSLSNLRYTTHSANVQHSRRAGRGAVGENHVFAKLKENSVIAIRAEFAGGVKIRMLSKKYGISKDQVVRIINRSAWKHVP